MTERRVLIPTERQEMKILAKWLNARGLLWLHPPNEGKRSIIAAALMKRDGLLHPGAPDVLVFERWRDPGTGPTVCDFTVTTHGHGLAIELKRSKGGRTTETQHGWLEALESRGWAVKVAHGAQEAILWLEERLAR